ncbi:MAG: O-antigen ligase family protein [Hyphomicrobiaceae bacterium]
MSSETKHYWQPARRLDVFGIEMSERLFGRMVGSALIAMVFAAFAAPRSTPFQLGLVMLMAIAVVVRDGRRWGPLLRPSVPVVLLLAFSGFALLSAIWARDSARAFELALMFLANVLGGILLVRWVEGESGERLARLGLGLLMGLSLGLAFLTLEMSTGQIVKRLLFNSIDVFRPDTDKHFGIRHGEIVRIAVYYLNRGIAVMVLLLWPIALIASLWPVKSRRRLMVYGFLITATALTAFSAHETSKLALLLSFAGFALAQASTKWAWRSLYAVWVVMLVGAVPMALTAHRAGLAEVEAIQDSGRARIILWGVTAARTLDNPILGVGADSTREIDAELAATAVKEEGAPFALRTGRHAHNVYLQTWFELGGIGAALMLVAGLALFRRLYDLPERARPFVFAALVAGIVMAGLSWGLWQPWLAAAYSLMALSLAVAIRYVTTGIADFWRPPDSAGSGDVITGSS